VGAPPEGRSMSSKGSRGEGVRRKSGKVGGVVLGGVVGGGWLGGVVSGGLLGGRVGWGGGGEVGGGFVVTKVGGL